MAPPMTPSRRSPAFPWLAVAVSLATQLAAAGEAPDPRPLQPGVAFARHTVAGGDHPFAVAVADVDADAIPDLLVTNIGADTVSVLLGRGDGTFAEPVAIATGRFPRGIASADFDGDGHLDLAVAANQSGQVALHRGDGSGRFSPPRHWPVGAHPFLLTAADVDGDGRPDVLVALEGAAGIAVLRNDGAGGFAPAERVAVGRQPTAVATGDVNGDGTTDAAVLSWGANEIAVLIGDGRGGFAGRQTLRAAGHGLFGLALADMDGDRHLDLLWTDMKQQAAFIRFGDGTGRFDREAIVPMGAGLRSAVAADLNGDGRLDVAGSNQSDGTVSLALTRAGGSLQPVQIEPVGTRPRMVAAGDFDRDGRIDLVATNSGSNDLTVLLNRGAADVRAGAAPRPTATPPSWDPATFDHPANIALDGAGHLYVADQNHHRIARIDLADGTVATVAGTGTPGFGGDGGPATAARLHLPSGVAVDAGGAILVADQGNHRIRRIDPDGRIDTIAGTGAPGFSGDGGPMGAAALNSPFAVLVDGEGRLVIGDFGNARVRRVAPDGTIDTVLGTGLPGYSGDGGPGVAARIGPVTALGLHPSGDLLIGEASHARIRRLGRDGIVTTVRAAAADGHGHAGEHGDELGHPAAAAADAAGRILITDQEGNRVRRVADDGTVEPVAGTGEPGFSGDGGPAVAARLWLPFGLAVDWRSGTVYIADRYNHAIRSVDAAGVIRTVAGEPRERPWTDIIREAPTLARPAPLPTVAPPRLVWKQTFFSGSDVNAPFALAVSPDCLYVVGDVGSGADATVRCLAAGGSERWRFLIGSPALEILRGVVAVPDGLVAVGEAGGDGKDVLVVALTADGAERWRRVLPAPGDQVAHGVAADAAGNLYIAAENRRHWELISLTGDGTHRWTRHGPRGAALGVAAAAGGQVTVAGHDDVYWRVDAYTADGGSRWHHRVAPALPGATGAIAAAVALSADGAATVAGMWTGPDGPALRVERLAAGGEPRWAYVEPAPPRSFGRAVALDRSGRAFVAGESGTDWLLLSLDAQGRRRWRTTVDGGGGEFNKDQALALALREPDALFASGVFHPEPPRPPSLGSVQWRIARYELTEP